MIYSNLSFFSAIVFAHATQSHLDDDASQHLMLHFCYCLTEVLFSYALATVKQLNSANNAKTYVKLLCTYQSAQLHNKDLVGSCLQSFRRIKVVFFWFNTVVTFITYLQNRTLRFTLQSSLLSDSWNIEVLLRISIRSEFACVVGVVDFVFVGRSTSACFIPQLSLRL